MELNHLIEAQQLTPEIIYSLFSKAELLRTNKNHNELQGKILTTLFYEPSTRTRLSFESAMIKMGGSVIGTENAAEFSSAVKGESIEDTIRIIGAYSDIIVIRHPEEGSALKASKVSNIPIINGGDGKGQHPTQALLDIYTIYREFNKLEGLKIALVGDLLNGRTARSLCYLLGKFKENTFIFVSPENLKMKEDIKEYLKKHNSKFIESNNLNEILPNVDIVYMTRIQKERISPEEYQKSKGKYVLNKENLNLVRENARILHPLPHVEEIDISPEIEKIDRRIAYFRQAENGLYIRIALLSKMLNY
jgi:aspartate carbamoyltransferase catalytic subunit